MKKIKSKIGGLPISSVNKLFDELLVEMHETFYLHEDFAALENFANKFLLNYIGDLFQHYLQLKIVPFLANVMKFLI